MIDLHTHTKYSDGDLDILGNVNSAISKNIKGIAITDHDNISSWKDIDMNNYPIVVIKGVELSTYHKGDVVHVLGYYLNDGGDYRELEEFLVKTCDDRIKRLELIISKLKEYGINITKEDVLKVADGAIARPHIAHAIMNKYPERGYTKDEIFNKYIGNNAPCFVPVNKFETIDGIKLLKRNHCLVIIAHPLLITKFDYKELLDYGIDGYECFYKYSNKDYSEVLDFCIKNDLVITGGSDYHGPITRNSIGDAYLTGEYVEKFLEKINYKK